jgi:hypothetical protein
MSQATAMFRSELRAAVQQASAPNPAPPTSPAPTLAATRLFPPRPVRRTVVRLWLPLTPLWLILSPFAILLAPLLLLAPQTRGIRPFRAAFAIGATLLALSGTEVDVDTPDALVRIRIY